MAINIGTNTDGDVTYKNPPVDRVLFPNIKEGASLEEIQAAVDAWLDDHPEATTTVEDGSILPVKLDSTNSATDGYVLSYNATEGKFEWYDVGGELDEINSDITDLKQDFNKISGQTRNLITGFIPNKNIESNGTYWNSNTLDVYYAPVTQDTTYYVTTDDASGLVCAFYENEPKTSGASYNSSRTVQNSKVITAPIDGYIAFRTNHGYAYAQIEAGTTPTEYIQPVTAKDDVAREVIEKTSGEVNELVKIADSLTCEGNVFDPSSVVEGYRVSGSQNETLVISEDENACYFAVPIIGKNNELTVSFVGFPYWYFGDGFAYIVSSSDNKILTPVYGNRKGVDYRTFTGSWTTENTNMVLYINCTMKDKDNFAVYINEIVKQYTPYNGSALSIKNSPIYGKKICCNGDSIMYGAGATGGFASIIANIYDMTLQNIAVSGGTIASGTQDSGTDRHWIAETMSDLADDGDYYIIEGGVNDYSLNVPLYPSGESAVRTNIKTTYPSDLTSFTEAMEAICYELVVNHTGKKHGFIIPHKLSYLDWTSNSESKTYMAYKDAQKQILKKWGIPYLDLSEVSGMDTIFDSIASAYTSSSDRYHPNQRGYEQFYVPHIVRFMEQL